MARKIGTSHTTIGRQVAAENLSPGIVIALCRAYGRRPVDGPVETGYIYPHEVETGPIAAVLPSATNKQLLDEIMRRNDPEARRLFGADGDDDVVDLDPSLDHAAEVFDLRPTPIHGSTYDVHDMPDGAVADGSPDEGDGYPDNFEP
ncbi:hypothetical protein [Corynebacterium bovis]|uniref:hypothetical protein n=1 Tax=Corynebacterium bovis TaxID=36808 RepID=UPI003139DE19